MHALRPIVVSLIVAMTIVFSSGAAVMAASPQRISTSAAAADYEGTPVVTYSIVNAWPKKYTGM